ncbi:hypothetical protein N7523_005579 [Penicillium sp. IBT 18751x]|nr:hypothetical protein N7523_005834 [Penicillium sp. IBT 18751x]KAJ6117828.1 hypothetical protein N7523_005579 [Penicillium sp. IBT 18751x]
MPSKHESSKPTKRAVLSKRNSTLLKPPKDYERFRYLLEYLQQPLQPLVSYTTGHTHEDFPSNMLAYYLLTSIQLNNLAHHFHQVWPPVNETFSYTVYVPTWIDAGDEEHESLKSRRSRFGKFIGLSRDWLSEENFQVSAKVEQLLRNIENDYYGLSQ